jgi:hypothetical protein
MIKRNVWADIIRPNEPPLSKYGEFLKIAIDAISAHYANVAVDKYCIMPGHVHMIVFILPDENGRMISAPYIPDFLFSSAME